ncbi:hypothetical protein [Calothrix sp. PCC 6303]|uniref:hypothetical protein n=1 Tax=Calothrix sp. PCC 6303 TaxID=1170562 RepID=UPI0002A0523C|nr:hypothetical protein [Calothrix sp. PCC 6303]AFY99355.1 hypothetical protein Cal6303_0258 [Calothrix sp. PCC 6303]
MSTPAAGIANHEIVETEEGFILPFLAPIYLSLRRVSFYAFSVKWFFLEKYPIG